MKLFVQIPCWNEQETLPLVLNSIPRQMPGVDEVKVLVVDDGSEDRTVEVARESGADYIVRHACNKGLARTFRTGLDACLRLGADVIVNTDADNQYPQQDIPRLIAPVIAGAADIVVGDRQTWHIDEFSPGKKLLQALGSRAVRAVSGTSVADSVSGFRAYSREAALRLVTLTSYSYTVENIIQAGKLGLITVNVPVETNPQTRPSRLKRSSWDFIKRQGATILRLFALYEPLRTFFYISLPFGLAGLFLLLRYIYYQFQPEHIGAGRHVQSLVVGAALLTMCLLLFILGVLADLIAANRRLTEETLYRLRRLEMTVGEPSVEIECVAEVRDLDIRDSALGPDPEYPNPRITNSQTQK